MNLCDQCETVSHCTAHGCIPLTECINSGQVSAAQAAAHQQAGELPEPFGFLLPTERSPAFHYMRRSDEKGMSVFSADQMRAAIAAERAEVARLREALQNLWNASEGTSDAEISARLKARAALAATQGASHE